MILDAAVAVFAEEGLGAPVSKIAARVGIAQGSIFNYFATKTALLNETYLHLIADLEASFPSSLPEDAQFDGALKILWDDWLHWNTADPNRRITLRRLFSSEHITAETQAKARELEEPGARFLRKAAKMGALRDQPDAFIYGIVGGIAQTAIDFMLAHPDRASFFCDLGYQTFRKALS